MQMLENCVWISFCSFSCLFLCVEYLEKESSATTCHWAHSVAEDHLELLIFLPLPPKCWEFIHTQPLSVLLCNFIIIIIIIHVHICLWIICTALCYFVYFQTHYDIFFFHSLRNFMDLIFELVIFEFFLIRILFSAYIETYTVLKIYNFISLSFLYIGLF